MGHSKRCAESEVTVEVKIGVKGSPRELNVETDTSPEDVVAAVRAVAGVDNAVLELTDIKGRRVLVPAHHIAYVEIGEQETRKVGFGAT
jgi:hypothetical protein